MRTLLVRSLPILLLLAACGSEEGSTFYADSGREAPGLPSGGISSSSGGAGSGGDGLPAEREIESDYEAPVATGNVVWIANPKSGRVALVDAVTLQVRTVEAGNAPTYLASVPNQQVDTTLVLNVASADATLLRATSTAGAIETTTFKTAQLANTSTFSSDGRYAVVWADARKVPDAPKTRGFQDLTVLDLQTGTSTILAVGYRPVAVGFSADNTQAYAVTQDGIALVALAGTPAVTKNVAISDSPTEDPGTRDVFVTKDGARAFIRRDGSSTITIVTLATDQRSEITLSGPVTDLDLADTGDRAVAVVRSTAEVALIPIADPSGTSSITVTGETIGSVAIAPGGTRALLYTNATAAERFTVLDLGATPTFRTVRLYSPVLGIFAAPDAQHAIVLHDRAAPSEDGAIPASGGAFSVVPIGQNLPAKIVATLAPPTAVATLDDRAVVAERNDAAKVYGAHLVRMPQLMAERYPLASPPIAVGAVPGARRAFIAQQHPEGRLTFIDLETGVARTLTGFELSSRVVTGSAAN
ncbi:MAG: hypothetical protein KIT84_25735 [Labilithrix sp.]|nr:hypothetical protein [Labilithrix sp.]MCW5814455.1 hypothetical protein [Labilithrix sp.]